MEKQFSESELVSFLEYLAAKNLLNSSTASARKAAVIKILSSVDSNEKQDLRTLDRDQLFYRFTNKYSKDFTPDSLVTYKSRFNAAMNDFLSYQENPAGFRAGTTKRTSKDSGSERKINTKKTTQASNSTFTNPTEQKVLAGQGVYVLPIPISNGTLIEIRNLPLNLSAADAKKIATIIEAHAVTGLKND